jgi:hypothetical protein
MELDSLPLSITQTEGFIPLLTTVSQVILHD